MVGRRSYTGLAGIALVIALVAPGAHARGQALPSPTPVPRADQNAQILKPLNEIGRTRARTPYCRALGRARAGIDAAIAFEFSAPVLARDLRGFRLDSYLAKHLSLKKSEHDLSALWDLAVAGRDDVRALRTAANAEGVDEQQRKAMLDFANALDGAKARQMMLAKSIAGVVAVLAETPVRDIANTSTDDHSASAFDRGSSRNVAANAEIMPTPSSSYTSAQSDAIADDQRLQSLFTAFMAEEFIRDDLETAAKRGNTAMQLGNCSGI
jgi:hypothetical protein